MTITEFLLARIAEDEQVAHAASGDGDRWQTTATHGPIVAIDDGTEWGGDPVIYDEGSPSEEQAAHIARHDPARVLAECEAMRRIVGKHAGSEPWETPDGERRACMSCGYWEDEPVVDYPCENLRILASIWADHADYDPAWRIE